MIAAHARDIEPIQQERKRKAVVEEAPVSPKPKKAKQVVPRRVPAVQPQYESEDAEEDEVESSKFPFSQLIRTLSVILPEFSHNHPSHNLKN